jgi:hypothetical protein
MQPSLKMYLQLLFTKLPLKISFNLWEFEISHNILKKFPTKFQTRLQMIQVNFIYTVVNMLTNTHMINKVFVVQFQIYYKLLINNYAPAQKMKGRRFTCNTERLTWDMLHTLSQDQRINPWFKNLLH